ncbi:MAG TPA: bifunctional (p)ppGpp synthetase/guanosine-3',5'-bis(diphosphate) 3'-pyrophosphohydrolase [Patescibacteria group bacterium]|nr:bifunctional (p)ppGpp synthetase/guanosine-3',5'-bis(diphosphate) 3'-pyrophosphohydrolase [Patescibacteria group bacterium]
MVENLHNQLLAKLKENGNAYDLPTIERAFQLANTAHEGQKRFSGEPYIIHSLHAAITLADMSLDTATISAALLHDVPEDTSTTLAEIDRQFGKEIAFLVEGVTKLGKIRYPKYAEENSSTAQALYIENLRKMFFATANDIRVILIKLADRLHNIQTLSAVPKEKQRRIAIETIEVFAPVAHRLGMGHLKGELEDAAFPFVDPKGYAFVQKSLEHTLGEHEIELHDLEQAVIDLLNQNRVPYTDIHGRTKHLWSLWKKLNRPEYNRDIRKIYDLVALRVIVPSVKDAYAALGIIHQSFRPLIGRIKDYIATPKPSGYQSLHTTVFGPSGKPMEIQIRTPEMHHDAEYGVTAHWAYTESGKPQEGVRTKDRRFDWIRQLQSWQKQIGNSKEFWENIQNDFFQNRIFVFTPKGDALDLPEGSCVIDFAFTVHSDLGHRMMGAKINEKMSPITQKLQSGDVVEILVSKNPKGPHRDWVGFCKTTVARQAIRQWFRKQSRSNNLLLGKKLLESELRAVKQTLPDSWSKKETETVLRKLQLKNPDDLFVAIGQADTTPSAVLRALAPEAVLIPSKRRLPRTLQPIPLPSPSLLMTAAKCCSPKEGDAIMGYISSAGRGLMVHKESCGNIRRRKNQTRLLRLGWRKSDIRMITPVQLMINGQDRIGLLNDITTVIAKAGVNIENLTVESHKKQTAAVSANISVIDLDELQMIFSLVRQIPGITNVQRM